MYFHYIFTLKYNVPLGFFKFGLGLKVLASALPLSVWPHLISLKISDIGQLHAASDSLTS